MFINRVKKYFKGRNFCGEIVGSKENVVGQEKVGGGGGSGCGRREGGRTAGSPRAPGNGYFGQTAVVGQVYRGRRSTGNTVVGHLQTSGRPTVQQPDVPGKDQGPEERAELAGSVQTTDVEEQEESFAHQGETYGPGTASPATGPEDVAAAAAAAAKATRCE